MPIKIKAGDKIEDAVTYTASTGVYSLSVSQLTPPTQSYTKAIKCAAKLVCARQSAEWIVERPTTSNGAYAPLADWKSARLTTDQAATTTTTNSKTKVVSPVYEPASTFSNSVINMVSDSYTGETLATTGLLDSAGVAFSDTWNAAQ